MGKLMVTGLLVVASACGGDDDSMMMDAADAATFDSAAEEQFVLNVAPLMAAKCDSCHGEMGGGAPLIPSNFAAVTQYPGLLSCQRPTQSLLLTKGVHAGPAFDPASEVPAVEMFITTWASEAEICMGADEASTGPTTVIVGENTVDLSPLGPGLAGATLTFTAEKVGVDDLYLSLMTVNAGANGLHVVGPLFEFCITEANSADLLDSFGAVDLMVDANMSAQLGPGTLAFPDAFGSDMNVRFESITPMSGSQGDPVPGGDGCMAAN